MSTPIATSAFIASIGVNVDMDFFNTPYGNAPAMAADIAYLGVKTVRDLLPASDPFSLAPYAALAAEGVRFDLIAGVSLGGVGLPGMAMLQTQLDAFEAAYPGSIASVEGPNEPNIYPFDYAGETGVAAAVAYQSDLAATVESDPLLKGVSVVNFAFGGVDAGVYAQAGDADAIAASGNFHVYPDGNGCGAPGPEILLEQSLAAASTPGEPTDMTEFGYSTYAGADIGQAAQADYELDGLFDAAADGVASTCLYELVDGATGSSDYEENFGQFESDGMTPKLAAAALHNLTSILADAGTAAPSGDLNYSVSGLAAAGGNAFLMERSDGAFDIAIWTEPAAADLSTANAAVTVELGASFAVVEVFDPTSGAAPTAILRNVSAVSLALTGHPLIVEVEPAPAPAPASVAMPAAALPIATFNPWQNISVDSATISSSVGSHAFFLDGTGDALTATGGAETVSALQGGNALTTGGGDDTITFGGGSTVDAGAGTNTLTDTGSASTIVLPAAGAGIDDIHGAVMSNGDTFDLRALLQATTWNGASTIDLGDYIRIRTAAKGADVIISVAPTGAFSAGGEDVAHIYRSGAISLATLLAHSLT